MSEIGNFLIVELDEKLLLQAELQDIGRQRGIDVPAGVATGCAYLRVVLRRGPGVVPDHLHLELLFAGRVDDILCRVPDRKSGVEGKIVSVRVDLGVRSIIKTKHTLKSQT